MDISPMHILLLLLIILVLFGGKKIPEVMRGLGQGVKEFKAGMKTEEQAPTQPQAQAPANPAQVASQPAQEKK